MTASMDDFDEALDSAPPVYNPVTRERSSKLQAIVTEVAQAHTARNKARHVLKHAFVDSARLSCPEGFEDRAK